MWRKSVRKTKTGPSVFVSFEVADVYKHRLVSAVEE